MFLKCFIKLHLEIVFITWHTLYWFWFRKSGSFVGCIFFYLQIPFNTFSRQLCAVGG